MHMGMVVVGHSRVTCSTTIGCPIVKVIITMLVAVMPEMCGMARRVFQRIANAHRCRVSGVQREHDGKKKREASAHGRGVYSTNDRRNYRFTGMPGLPPMANFGWSIFFEAKAERVSALDADVIKTYVEPGLGIAIIASMAFNPAKDGDLHQLHCPRNLPVSEAHAQHMFPHPGQSLLLEAGILVEHIA